MNDTTRWIMIILLLLLIAAAVFMLLRSPGKDNGTGTDAALAGRDTDRDGLPDRQEGRVEPAATADRGVYDQEAETATMPAAERAEEHARPDALDDRDRDSTLAYDTTAPAGKVPPAQFEDGSSYVTPSADDTAEPYRPEAGAVEGSADVHRLSDAEIDRAGSDAPLTAQEKDRGGVSEETATDERVSADGRGVDAGGPDMAAAATAGAAAATAGAATPPTDEWREERRDEAGYEQGTLDSDAPAPTDGAGWDPAPADTGTGAPPTADEIAAGRTDTGAYGRDETAGTGTSDYAPVFTEAAYGPGSAEPLEDGTGPAGWEIKGNIGSMLFHTPESPSYDAVRAEVWFESEEAARAAGFAHWDRRRR